MTVGPVDTIHLEPTQKDVQRAEKLGKAKSGSAHDHFLAGIIVQADIKYPLYWSPEAQRYHWFEIISSQSTMHRLTTAGASDEFDKMFNKYVLPETKNIVKILIQRYNFLLEYRLSEETGKYTHPDTYIEYTFEEYQQEKYFAFMDARSNLPSGYEMWMTISTSYLQLKTMYLQRKGHKLKEDWGAFCEWVLGLPSFKELTGLS
jgi:hypothetical protein